MQELKPRLTSKKGRECKTVIIRISKLIITHTPDICRGLWFMQQSVWVPTV